MGEPPRVGVVLPRMLSEILGRERIEVRAETVEEAMSRAYGSLPALRRHVCDEDGTLRTHVLLVHNGVSCRETGTGGRVREGDEIRIVQAISGG